MLKLIKDIHLNKKDTNNLQKLRIKLKTDEDYTFFTKEIFKLIKNYYKEYNSEIHELAITWEEGLIQICLKN